MFFRKDTEEPAKQAKENGKDLWTFSGYFMAVTRKGLGHNDIEDEVVKALRSYGLDVKKFQIQNVCKQT